jgi:protein SCO1/2
MVEQFEFIQTTESIVRSIAGLVIALAILVSGCNSNTSNAVSAPAARPGSCLINAKLTDQHGQLFSLASLKGRAVLFDFFYTTCPGPCLVLTARMRSIAEMLDGSLGTKIAFVSVTVDPEVDTAQRLLSYAKEQRADRKGWVFLTGAPGEIDKLMRCFGLVRRHEPDGSVDHVLEFFLVGPDGHLRYQYLASQVNSEGIAYDLERAAGLNLVRNEKATASD